MTADNNMGGLRHEGIQVLEGACAAGDPGSAGSGVLRGKRGDERDVRERRGQFDMDVG